MALGQILDQTTLPQKKATNIDIPIPQINIMLQKYGTRMDLQSNLVSTTPSI